MKTRLSKPKNRLRIDHNPSIATFTTFLASIQDLKYYLKYMLRGASESYIVVRGSTMYLGCRYIY